MQRGIGEDLRPPVPRAAGGDVRRGEKRPRCATSRIMSVAGPISLPSPASFVAAGLTASRGNVFGWCPSLVIEERENEPR